MKALPFSLLLMCAGCNSATLSDSETITVLTAAKDPGAGFGPIQFGQSFKNYAGLGEMDDNGPDGISFTHLADTLAYGVVSVKDIIYVFRNGGFSQASFTAVGYSNGNKLQGCLEQLYGPLERKAVGEYHGSRGKALLMLTRNYSGDASAMIINADDWNAMLNN